MTPSIPLPFMRRTEYLAASVGWIAVALLAAPPSSAQRWGTVELSPAVGTFVPTAQLPPVRIGCTAGTGPSCLISRQQTLATAFGGRVTAWANRRVALEGSLWYSPTVITGDFAPDGMPLGVEAPEAPVTLLATSIRIMVSPIRGAGLWAYMVGGPALISRSGDAYGLTGNSRFGGVVGAGAHLRVARSLAVRAEVEDYLYSLQGYHQQDLFVSLGLSVASRIGSAATP